jgi:hypothetical protein
VINTVTIDGKLMITCSSSQPPGIELELWLAKTSRPAGAADRDLPLAAGRAQLSSRCSRIGISMCSRTTPTSLSAGRRRQVQVALKPAAPLPAGKKKASK